MAVKKTPTQEVIIHSIAGIVDGKLNRDVVVCMHSVALGKQNFVAMLHACWVLGLEFYVLY